MDDEGRFVKQSKNDGGKNRASRFGGLYDYDIDNIVHLNVDVIYIGPLKNHWGHLLVDCLSRVWAAALVEYRDLKLAYLEMDEPLDERYFEFFDLMEIPKERLLKIIKPTLFHKVIIPEQSYIPGAMWHQEYKNTIQHIISKIKSKSYLVGDVHNDEKIYLSRTKWPVPSIYGEYGEKQIEGLFRRNGFTIVYPEEITLPELISLLSSAKYVISPMGTTGHASALFALNADELVVMNKRYIHVPHQVVLNELFNGNLTYVDTYYSKRLGIYWMGINGNLRRFCKNNGFRIPYGSFTLLMLCCRDFGQFLTKLAYNKLMAIQIAMKKRIKGVLKYPHEGANS